MDYKTFVNKIIEADIYLDCENERDFHVRKGVKRAFPVKARVEISWCTGGASGGSCYGGEARAFTSDEVEPEFEDLDKILELVAPKLSYLAYKRLLREVLQRDTRGTSDYYGNYSDYAVKRVFLEDLHKWLDTNGFLAGE